MAQPNQKTASQAAHGSTPGDTEKRIARPLTPEALAEYGELATVQPIGNFNPDGEWEQSYRIWMTGGDWDSYQGYVTLKRTPLENNEFRLDVLECLLMPRTRSVHETKVTARCRCNTLATPVTWHLNSRIYDTKTEEAFEDARVEQDGTADNSQIVITTNGRKNTTSDPPAWTWNWSLFEATQHRPGTEECPAGFSLLDDLDAMKAGQRLIRRGETTIQIGNIDVPVLRYDQIGRALLPTRYYVDESGRLLLAHTELRAYILDAAVQETHAKKLKWLAAKEMK